jgi:spoIIIJ-associated protein
MTRVAETTGKSVAEATIKALQELGIGRDEANIQVVDKGSRGFLGIFSARPARVRVSAQIAPTTRVEELTKAIISRMGFSTQLHITEEKNALIVDIETAGADGLLIGKAGSTLSSLEYLVNRILQRENKRTPRIVLDVSGYKSRREDFLKNKALSLAEEVRSAKQQVTMEPLDAEDRKVVHSVLKSVPGVTTKSVGSGRTKSVVVVPAGEESAPRSSGRRPRRRKRRS